MELSLEKNSQDDRPRADNPPMMAVMPSDAASRTDAHGTAASRAAGARVDVQSVPSSTPCSMSARPDTETIHPVIIYYGIGLWA